MSATLVVYTIAGGFFSVAYTDVLQAGVGWIGCVIFAYYMIHNAQSDAAPSIVYPLYTPIRKLAIRMMEWPAQRVLAYVAITKPFIAQTVLDPLNVYLIMELIPLEIGLASLTKCSMLSPSPPSQMLSFNDKNLLSTTRLASVLCQYSTGRLTLPVP